MPDYSFIIAFCTRGELGQLFLGAKRVGDTDFADALHEAIKQRKDNVAPDAQRSNVETPSESARCICPTIDGERIEVVECPVRHREYRTLDGGFVTGPGQDIVIKIERVYPRGMPQERPREDKRGG